jgi:hypothetical protein
MQAWKRTLCQWMLEIIQHHGLVFSLQTMVRVLQLSICVSNSTSAFGLKFWQRGQNALCIEVHPDGLQCKNNLRNVAMSFVRLLYPYGINKYKKDHSSIQDKRVVQKWTLWCVCVCVCIYIYTHIHTHTHTQWILLQDNIKISQLPSWKKNDPSSL